MTHSIWIYIIVMAAVSFALRALPLTIIRHKIKNQFIRSFLHYLPYATIAVMTIPAIFYVSDNIYCGIAALIATGLVAWFTSNLLLSAVVACVAVFVVNLI